MVTRKFKITYVAQIVAYIMFWLDSIGLEAPSNVSLFLKNCFSKNMYVVTGTVLSFLIRHNKIVL